MRGLTFLVVVVAFAVGSAQSQTNLPVTCEKALPQVEALIHSAVESFEANDPAKSINTLKKILEMTEFDGMNGLCKAWVYQWLALSYDDLDTSKAISDSARSYIRLSLEENPEIWREHADSRLTPRLRKTYQDCWNEIETQFLKKRKSWRVAVGPITRAEFSNRFGIATGIGTTVISLEDTISKENSNDFKVNLFRDLLLYVRAQKMRKTLERLMAGLYGEFSLSLSKAEKPAKVLSFGPILGYAKQSGLEFGGTFEIARLVIGGGKTRISQTISSNNGKNSRDKTKLAFSYTNFELYLRKWF